ncbi:MAG: response regulator [Chloroflexota bacterium]|nr:response regulator [Chloroflexota bacterium]
MAGSVGPVIRAGGVLVVDDDAGIRELLRTILEGAGYEVRTAIDGNEALRLFQERRPDLILLDLHMPGVDGWGFARAYRAEPEPHPPVIVITAVQDAQRSAEEIGAAGHLAKPFDLHELLAIVDHFAGHPPS